MGPIEFVFLTLFLIFGIIGVMRGYGRELGVTTMLLLALFVLEFIDEGYQRSSTGCWGFSSVAHPPH